MPEPVYWRSEGSGEESEGNLRDGNELWTQEPDPPAEGARIELRPPGTTVWSSYVVEDVRTERMADRAFRVLTLAEA